MRVLITGGAGFIGSNLAKFLDIQGFCLCILDCFLTSKRESLEILNQVEVVEGSVNDSNLVEITIQRFKPQVVVHAAASYHEPENWTRDVETNVIGTINVIKACEKYNISRLIYLQTSLSYGLQNSSLPFNTNDPLFGGTRFPGSSYAASKAFGEVYLNLCKLDWICFRLANVYGPHNLSGPIPNFYKNLINGHRSVIVDSSRDFIYVEDLIYCLYSAIIGNGSSGAYNISSGFEYPILTVYHKLIEILGIDFTQIPEPIIKKSGTDDTSTLSLESALTRSEFKWVPKFNLTDGLRKTIDWYKLNFPYATYTHLRNIE